MLFNSLEFLIFLPIVVICFFVCPKKYRHIILLLASYVFYAFWNIKLIFLILATTLVSYFSGFFLNKVTNNKGRRFLLISTLVTCLGILVFFKYFNFLADSITSIINFFDSSVDNIVINIILPVGISFYTFQTLSYVIDVYNHKIEAERNPIYYALFVSFFPQLVAGPIERPENLLPQLKANSSFSLTNLTKGLKTMLVGFFKKIAIADVIGIYVNPIFSDVANTNGPLILLGAVLFAVQILCDFSGYSDIAVGTAKIFGIDLMQNFNKPYSSKSIKEFWNRWHISLSSWFKDYLYIPLGGSRCSYLRWIFNILVVFTVSGLWHGAAWTFVIWGVIHALYQIFGKFTLKFRNHLYDKFSINNRIRNCIRIVVTFGLVSLAWICFRANSLEDLGTCYQKLFTDWNLNSFSYLYDFLGLDIFKVIWLVGLLIALQFIDIIKVDFFSPKTSLFILRKAIYIVIIWIVMASWIYLNMNDVESAFLYFQF